MRHPTMSLPARQRGVALDAARAREEEVAGWLDQLPTVYFVPARVNQERNSLRGCTTTVPTW